MKIKLKSYVGLIAVGVFIMAACIYFGWVTVPPQMLRNVVIISIIIAMCGLGYTFLKNKPRRKKTLIGLQADINKFYGPEGMKLGEDGDIFETDTHFFSKFKGLDDKMYGLGILYNKDNPDKAKVYVKNLSENDERISWDGVDAADLNDIPRFMASKVIPVLFPDKVRLRAVTAFPKKKKGKDEGPTVTETTLDREEAEKRGKE